MFNYKLRIMTLATSVAAAGMAHGQAFNDFGPNNSSQPSGWVVDRYAPSTFSVGAAPDNGANFALQLGVSSNASSNAPFYHYNGEQKTANIASDWIVSGDIFVSAAMLAGGTSDAELWASDTSGGFGSIAFVSGAGDSPDTLTDSSVSDQGRDGSNPLGQWSIYDDQTGQWQNLGGGITEGWHTMSIQEIGGTLNYFADGNFLGSRVGAGAGNDALTTVFLESNNYGSATSNYWQNVGAAATPEPCTILGIGVAGLAFIRRRKQSA